MPPSCLKLASALLLACTSTLAACAEGSPLGAFGDSSNGGDGGASGVGGRGGAGPADGGAGAGDAGPAGPTSSGSTTPTSGSSSATASSTTVGSSTSSASATTSAGATTSSSAATTGAATTAGATTSASTGGGEDPICDPLSPALVCGAGQHCSPEPPGVDAGCSPAGSGQVYDPCLDGTNCTAVTACVDVGDPFALPCCLQYCRTAGDCGGLDTCYFFDPPVYADGVQYGVCFDGQFGFGC
jgi:hypothetical protein